MNKPFLLLLALGLAASSLPAQYQPDAAPEFVLHIARTTSPVTVDGQLDEAAWQACDKTGRFSLQFPVDTGFSSYQTEIRMCFDDRFLYVSAVCHQPQATYIVQSLKRDFSAGTSDALNFLFDPFRDGLNGFAFGVNPMNVQREALIDNGTTLSYDWDNKWYSEVQSYPEYWTAEIAIPFKTLRYKVASGQNLWRVNFVRVKMTDWEVSTWHPTKLEYPVNNLAFAGDLVWDEPPPKPGANISLIPYVTTRIDVNYDRDPNSLALQQTPTNRELAFGGDAKIAVTPSLNLDLTFNPDFSQVEVDRQVTNLSRFELFFPERRQFFLENRDLFAMFGFPSTRPFFSRRIGLAYNPRTGQNESVPILAGARLSGKLNNNWRVGLLNMQSRQVEWDSLNVLPASNVTVATVQRKMFSRSALSAIFVDKENFLSPLSAEQRDGYQAWHRVAGLEYNLYSQDNRWEGEWYYHRSFSPLEEKRGSTFAQFLAYRVRNFNVRLGYQYIDSTYSADAGFVPRTGIQSFFPGAEWIVYPKSKVLNNFVTGISTDVTYSLAFKEADRETALYFNLNFNNQAFISTGVANYYTYLFADFDPTNLYREGTLPLPGNSGYQYWGTWLEFNTSPSKALQAYFNVNGGEYFNGTRFEASTQLLYRWQPVGALSLNATFNRINLPEPYASADFWLIGPRAELAFSRAVFLSAFFQYNTQSNNFNINTRLQWRFAPVSDVFLVYTDNSFAERVPGADVRFFTPKNRALVLKVVYWLNV